MEHVSKNDIITLDISGYNSDGFGVAKKDGRVFFIKGAISGETAAVRVLKVGKNVIYGKIEKLLSPSPLRLIPSCPVYGKCGGCSLLHMEYDEELRYKKETVQNALLRIGGCAVAVSAIHPSPQAENYRNKVIYNIQLDGKTGRVVYGFFRPRTHDVVPASGCIIGFPEAESICRAVVSWMELYGVRPYDVNTRSGDIRHVFVRRGKVSGQVQVGIVTNSAPLPYPDRLVSALLSSCENIRSIVLNLNRSAGNTVLSGAFETIYGSDYIEDTLCGLTFRLSLRSFYQINHDQAESLYDKAVEYAGLTGRETVLDLYCGTGTITLCLAKRAGKAIGAEIVPQAIEDAVENANLNGIKNASFFCADASEIASKLASDGVRPDVITVDPPRKGLSHGVIESIVKMAPGRVVYISCDPGTLSRDIKLFEERGYRAEKAECFDMFPRCSHVETVVQLVRKQQS